jgi:hypothetical protein
MKTFKNQAIHRFCRRKEKPSQIGGRYAIREGLLLDEEHFLYSEQRGPDQAKQTHRSGLDRAFIRQ